MRVSAFLRQASGKGGAEPFGGGGPETEKEMIVGKSGDLLGELEQRFWPILAEIRCARGRDAGRWVWECVGPRGLVLTECGDWEQQTRDALLFRHVTDARGANHYRNGAPFAKELESRPEEPP